MENDNRNGQGLGKGNGMNIGTGASIHAVRTSAGKSNSEHHGNLGNKMTRHGNTRIDRLMILHSRNQS